MEYSEKWGTSIDEAVKLALEDLKLTKDEVDIEVLEQPSRGFFGIGSKLAKVRVEKKICEPEKPEYERAVEAPVRKTDTVTGSGRPVKVGEKPEKKSRSGKHQTGKKPKSVISEEERAWAASIPSIEEILQIERDLEPMEEHASLDFIKEVMEKMGLDLTVTGKTGHDTIYISINGKDAGAVIGKRGQTLDAIQYLASLVVNRDEEKYIRVIVDAENYRNKRGQTLEQLAEKLARKVVRNKKSVRLEPMNPYERKVIHATLQGHPKVTTKSMGDEPRRRVVIELK